MKGSLQEKSGKYYAVVRINGKQKWINTGIEAKRGNKRKAEAKLLEIVVQCTEHPDAFTGVPFVNYIDEWLENVKHKVDTVTYESYEQYTKRHIIPYFEPLKLNLQDVSMSDIEKYYNEKSISGRLDGKPGGLSYCTLKHHRVVLNLIFEYAMKNKLVKENPCQFAEIPREAKRSEKISTYYTPEQCQNLLDVIEGTPLYDMVYITFTYGLRRSELIGLKWDAIDFDAGTLAICHTVVVQNTVVAKDSTKNKTSNRLYPLLDDIKNILLRIRDEQDKYRELFGDSYNNSGYVFTRENGDMYYPSYPTHALSKVLKKNNLPHIRWHDLRHSCASMLIAKGWAMKDISEWLGHADIGTTMNIYGHVSIERKKELAKSLDGLL